MRSAGFFLPSPPLRQHLQHLLRRPGDDRLPACDDNRPLHQDRMLQQEIDDSLTGHIVTGIEPQLLEVFVFPHQICRRGWQHIEHPLECRSVERSFEIFDHVELDAALTQELERFP